MGDPEVPPIVERPTPSPSEHGAVERVRTPEERAEREAHDAEQREQGIAEAHEHLEAIQDERPSPEHDEAAQEHPSDFVAPRSEAIASRVARAARNMWEDTVYPSYDRVVRMGYVGTAFLGGAGAAGLLGAEVAAQAASLSALGVGLLGAAELAVRHRRMVPVSDLMRLNVAYDTPPDGTTRALAGEIHLAGREGLQRLQGLAPLEQRRAFLRAAADGLTSLQDLRASDDARVRDLDHFFGVTDVFTRRELASLGGSVTEVAENPAHQFARLISKRLLIVRTQGWRGLFRKAGKQRPLLRVTFTREQLAAAVARLATHTE